MYHGWTDTPQVRKERAMLIQKHKIEEARDKELAKIDAWYDNMRATTTPTIAICAAVFKERDAVLDLYEVRMAYLEAHLLAEAIMPQFVGQLQDGLPEKVIPYDRKSDIAFSAERAIWNAHAFECPAARDDDAPEHELSCTCGGRDETDI